jgi:hypothetical protein
MDITPDADGVTLVSSSLSVAQLPMEWDNKTAFALAARFQLQQVVQRVTAPPGSAAVIAITWHPAERSDTVITTRIPLPPLAPVPPEAFVTSSLSTPAVVETHTPFPLSLTVNNAHPTEYAYIAITGDKADGFVWTGPRGARVGPIRPGGSSRVAFEAVAVGNSGWQALPRLTVWHGDGQDRREVRVGLAADRPSGTVLVQP